jgi:hypothetical protein
VVESVRVEPIVSLRDEADAPPDALSAASGGASGRVAVVVSVRPRRSWQVRCGRCGRRCPGYDRGRGLRWWRTFDVGLSAALWRHRRHGCGVRCMG